MSLKRGDFLGVSSGRRDVVLLDEGFLDEVLLSESTRSRVVRRHFRGGTFIEKQFLGADAAQRVRHETVILQRMSAVPGVSKLSPALPRAGAIALQDVSGVCLAEVLRKETFGIAALLQLALDLTTTIAAMHRAGVVHGDIRPANILLSGSERRPVLIDFQSARISGEERPQFTAPPELRGELRSTAPDQPESLTRALDHRADLYALGATLYEVTTGRQPFRTSNSFQSARDRPPHAATPPAALDPYIPQTLSDIIMRLLEAAPNPRYRGADGVAADLTKLIEHRARGEAQTFRLGDDNVPHRLSPPFRLIGREAEMRALRAAFEDALAGRRNGLFIGGPPGVGKTTLSNELRSMVTGEGGWFVSGKFDGTWPNASTAVSGAFGRLFRLLLAEPEESIETFRHSLTRALGSNLALAATAFPELALVLGITPAPERGDPLQTQCRLAQLGLDILRTIATKRPIVFVLDDLQWASATPLAFVNAIIHEVNLSNVLFVGVHRVSEGGAEHPLHGLFSRWEKLGAPPRRMLLNNLPQSDLSEFLQDMLLLREGDAARLAEVVASRTGGNPFDTIEFISALRRDGALAYGTTGWTWDEAAIRRYVGEGDVLDLLRARLDALPAQTAEVLQMMACLGGDVRRSDLEAAAGFSPETLEDRLAPALAAGLIVLEPGAEISVRFRHDRVLQAAFRLEQSARLALHLALARRLSMTADCESLAAQQYLPVIDSVVDHDERLRVIAILRVAAGQARVLARANLEERFLAAALALLRSVSTPSDAPADLADGIENELHAALYQLGRLDEADLLYRSIAERDGDILRMVDSACVQIGSLTARTLFAKATALGLDFLARLGFVPPNRDELRESIERGLSVIYRWCDDEDVRCGEDVQPAKIERAAPIPPPAIAVAKLIKSMMPVAYFSDQKLMAWLVIESLQLWSEYGEQAELVGPIGHAGFITIAFKNDYRTGYRVARHILRLSERHGFAPETALARFLFSMGTQHWFEPFEESFGQARQAREGLLQSGDLQHANYTYSASVGLLLQCSSTLAEFASEAEAAIAFSNRTGNDQAADLSLPYRQLARALRGETFADGSFSDASFDEDAHVARLHNQTAAACFHVMRALSAYLFHQTSELLRHADAGTPHILDRNAGNPLVAFGHLLRAVSAARRVAAAAPVERPTLLTALDLSLEWFRRRAGDAPHNFLHMVRLIEAERAWALDEFQAASTAFEAALREAASASPRHLALTSDRAGHFYIGYGLERYGKLLLTDAHQLYRSWGATAKVRILEREHPFLLQSGAAPIARPDAQPLNPRMPSSW